MPDHQEIYRAHAGQYDRLVSCEDYEGRILHALSEATPLSQADVVELGAGTGRLTCLIAPLVRSVAAFDQSQQMLEVASAKLTNAGFSNWRASVGDHRRIDMPDSSADIVLSGWSICYVVVNNPDRWQYELTAVVAEMLRIVRPGGRILLLETLGTGETSPNPPSKLVPYYAELERHGFSRSWFRTDYRFPDLEEANGLTRFFFGDDMCAKIASDERGIILPECTGLWSLRKEP